MDRSREGCPIIKTGDKPHCHLKTCVIFPHKSKEVAVLVIGQHYGIRMILWNFFGIAKSVGTSDPSTPSRRKDMIRYSCMFAAAEKTSGQGLKVSFWWRVRVFTSLHIISISFLKEGGFPIFTYIDMCIIHFYSICVFDMTFCSDITWRTSNSHTHRNQSGHLIFQAVLHPEEIVFVLTASSLYLLKTFCVKRIRTCFLCQSTILDFAVWVFIIESNGEAPRRRAKNAGVLATDRFPVCGTLRRIIARRLNFEIRIGEAHSIH